MVGAQCNFNNNSPHEPLIKKFEVQMKHLIEKKKKIYRFKLKTITKVGS
jgi:hypothetical protein